MRNKVLVSIMMLAAFVAHSQTDWNHVVDEDIATMSKIHVLVGGAEVHRGALSDPFVVVRENGGQTEAYVNFGGYRIDRDIAMIMWIDPSGGEGILEGKLSQSGESIFVDDVETFINLLEDNSGNLVFAAVSQTGRDMIGRWSFENFSEAYTSFNSKE